MRERDGVDCEEDMQVVVSARKEAQRRERDAIGTGRVQQPGAHAVDDVNVDVIDHERGLILEEKGDV